MPRSSGHSWRTLAAGIQPERRAGLGLRALQGASEGEEAEAFEALFRAHVKGVRRMVGGLLGPAASEDDVDEVTQLVFIATHKALPRFRGESQISTWLYGIASRTVLKYLRSRGRYRAMIQRFESSCVLNPPPKGLEEELEDRRALERVWRALVRMKPDRRVLLVLHELEGHSVRDLAEMLGLRESTVRTRIRRARADLVGRLTALKESRYA
ncbi:MAG: RNA polymerase sigma factor [Myxococcota bacterium]